MKRIASMLGLALSIGLATTVPLGMMSNDTALGQTAIDLQSLRKTILSMHNSYRATHRSPDMTLSDSLNKSAQTWAEHLAKTGELEHSDSKGSYGENLYASFTTEEPPSAEELAADAVKDWYAEKAKYNYANPGFSPETGHFTQVVWKNSTQLGCGAAQGTKMDNGMQFKAFYVVCQYTPTGNVTGQYRDNVSQP